MDITVTYKTRELFDIAHTDDHNVQLQGLWYRNSSLEFVVFDHGVIKHRGTDYRAASDAFEQRCTEYRAFLTTVAATA